MNFEMMSGISMPLGAPISSAAHAAPHSAGCLSVNGSAGNPIENITVSGVGFRDARATYLDPHGVPSGGDWALQRSGAIFLEDTAGVEISNCSMERNDGNAIMVSGHNVGTVLTENAVSAVLGLR